MINKLFLTEEKLKELVLDAYNKSVSSNELNFTDIDTVDIECAKDKKFGDFATNFALKISKELKKNPKEIAEILISKFKENPLIKKAEVAGPGFINFFLSEDWLYDSLKYILENPDTYGKVNIGNGKKVMVEFISANPTGPMHIGNARGGALGDCLANVLDYAGYDVKKEFYVNDYGNQIEKFAVSLNARFMQAVFGNDSIEFPEDAYHGQDIIDLVNEFIEEYGKEKYIEMSEDERKSHLTEFGLKKNIEKLKNDTARYGITYDKWFYESDLHKSGEVFNVINLLTEKGYTYKQDDAVWFKATQFGASKDVVLIRGNSVPTYFAADIAYHKNKIDRGFDILIDIWGADHHGHVPRIKGALDALGLGGDKLTVILMQLVRLIKNNDVYKVSKRSGKAVTLTDLLDETGKDAARFFFNLRQANTHFDFDLDLAVSKSNENPVFYVQYAHARICSIISLLEDEGISTTDYDFSKLSKLKEKEELDLLERITYFPQEITEAAQNFDPSRITRYIVSVAASFHSFYSAHRVKTDDKDLMEARLMLIAAAKITLANALKVLGIEAPERM